MKFFILAIFAVIGVVSSVQYCDHEALCKFYTMEGTWVTKKHISCGGNFANICPADARAIAMDATNKGLILRLHNTLRNALAAGQVNGFATAAAMPEMTWDDDLAEQAALNAMTCNYGHDDCHNTPTYKWSGQNIAKAMNSQFTDQSFIEDRVNSWWAEFKDCTQAILDKFGSNGKMIGHFTAMANERSNKIGCAASFFNNYRYLVCNYGYNNMGGEQIYTKGPLKSKCTSASTTYPNLCSASQIVRPVPNGW